MIEKVNQIEQQLPEMMHLFEVCLRSGYNIKQSFEIMGQDLAQPMAGEMTRLVDMLDAGTALFDVLDGWLNSVPSADLDLLIAMLKVQMDVGGNLADKLSLLAQMWQKRRGITAVL
jgi:tight adherence protein B